jgi:hypothetical protein
MSLGPIDDIRRKLTGLWVHYELNGRGLSRFLLNIAYQSMLDKIPCLFVSGRITAEQYFQRLYCIHSEHPKFGGAAVSYRSVSAGTLSPEESRIFESVMQDFHRYRDATPCFLPWSYQVAEDIQSIEGLVIEDYCTSVHIPRTHLPTLVSVRRSGAIGPDADEFRLGFGSVESFNAAAEVTSTTSGDATKIQWQCLKYREGPIPEPVTLLGNVDYEGLQGFQATSEVIERIPFWTRLRTATL